MRFKTFVICALSLTIALGSQAQSMVDRQRDSIASSTRVVAIDGGRLTKLDAKDREFVGKVLNFYYDQFRNFQDPGAPYFMFMSSEHNVMMGIGGAVRLRAWFDWGGAMPFSRFQPYFISIPGDPTNKRHISSTAAGTALFFRVIGNNKLFGDYQAYIEAGFSGYNSQDFKLKKAYVTWREFTVGLANSTFCDLAAETPMVDAAGTTNKSDKSTVLFRYMPRLSKHVQVAVSVETPETFVAADGVQTKAASTYVPDFAAFVQWDWGVRNSQHVRLSGVVRQLCYRDLIAGKNHSIAGWGLQFSSMSHPADPLTLYLCATVGRGYAGMGGDLSLGNYDLVGGKEAGRLYAPKSWGWQAGLQYNFKPNLFSCVTVSQFHYRPVSGVSPSEYKHGTLAAINLFWSPVARVTIGAELDFAKRVNFSGAHGTAHRAQVTAMLDF